MAQIDALHYLAVHDDLSFETGPRISVIEVVTDQNVTVTPTRPKKWQHEDGRSSDLEGVCSLPTREGEFLLIEAGHWEGEYGRMFHVQVNIKSKPFQIKILHVYELDEFNAKGRNDPDGDEIEGIACATRKDGKTLVILGERGGSSVYPTGLLRWVVVDLNSHSRLQWTAASRAGKAVNAPGSWNNSRENRDISALYLDTENILWAAAAEDLSDSGPFRSIVFKVATVDAEDSDPIKLATPYSVLRTVDGFKIEALAAGTSVLNGSIFAIGSDHPVYIGHGTPQLGHPEGLT